MQSGKAVIVGIFLLAILATGYAWRVQYQRGRQTLQFWGSELALAIRHAEQVDLIVVDATDGNRTIPLNGTRGLVHARQALVVDASYDWDADVENLTPKWEYGLRFTDGAETHAIWFDLEQALAGTADGTHKVKLTITDGLRTFLSEKVTPDQARRIQNMKRLSGATWNTGRAKPFANWRSDEKPAWCCAHTRS